MQRTSCRRATPPSSSYDDAMEKVIGIGGIFFKADDQPALVKWYQENLGIDVDPSYGGAFFEEKTAWSIMKTTSKHFEPSTKQFMVNYRVENLDAMLAQLRAAGVVVEKVDDSSGFGRFAW